MAAYWGVSDANLMLLSGKESKHTNVTYQIYDKFDTEKDSSRVLNRISADIRNMTRETNLTSRCCLFEVCVERGVALALQVGTSFHNKMVWVGLGCNALH